MRRELRQEAIMKARLISICFSLASLMIATSPDVLAQRGGGHGSGMGAGGGMGVGGAMPSGVQRGPDAAASGRGSDASASAHGAASEHQPADRGKTPSDLLKQNTKLSDHLAKLLPAGTDLQAAASGFKNLGQFVAAVHVSHNLGIPFDQLKAKMVGPPSESLGKAIHDLKPTADAKAETKKAEAEAHQDLDNDSGK